MEPAETLERKANRAITISASKVMLGGIFSLVFGLISQVVIAAIFGAGAGMDAYLTAIVIPNYFQVVILWNVSFAFIPAFIQEEESGNKENAWAMVGTFFWIIAVILFIIAIVGSLFSTQLIALTAPGFREDKAALAANMLSILMFTAPLTGLNGFTTGIQNARNRFFWPSMAPAIGSLANVVVVVILNPIQGPMSLCWGYLASVIFQSGVTIFPVILHGWKRMMALTDPIVIQLGKLIAPLLCFGFITSLATIFERYFASGLPDGDLSYIGYAYRISTIFVALFASGIASAIFPSMARSFSQDGISGLARRSKYGLKVTFAVAFPTIFIVSALAAPLVRILFERGAFIPENTIGVSRIVTPVIIDNVFSRMVGNILTRTSYVLKDTLTPPIISAISTVIYFAVGRFFVSAWGYSGLVWARTLQGGIGISLLWLVVIRKLKKEKMRSVFTSGFEYFLASAASYLAIRLVIALLASTPAILQLAAGGLVGLALYLLVLYIRDREILISVLGMIGIMSLIDLIQKKVTGPKIKKSSIEARMKADDL